MKSAVISASLLVVLTSVCVRADATDDAVNFLNSHDYACNLQCYNTTTPVTSSNLSGACTAFSATNADVKACTDKCPSNSGAADVVASTEMVASACLSAFGAGVAGAAAGAAAGASSALAAFAATDASAPKSGAVSFGAGMAGFVGSVVAFFM
ncbi:hypothetical protein BJ741DRAFT_624700 [Chytriomyces cf. hyalinus JEL632]|nr:hypothetical protein BJ741DRAFT_624700 [Chytriomyces cf. hyalinus JEL632]